MPASKQDDHIWILVALVFLPVMDLPQPFGRSEFVHTSHSETATIPGAFKDKGVREATWRLHGRGVGSSSYPLQQ